MILLKMFFIYNIVGDCRPVYRRVRLFLVELDNAASKVDVGLVIFPSGKSDTHDLPVISLKGSCRLQCEVGQVCGVTVQNLP